MRHRRGICLAVLLALLVCPGCGYKAPAETQNPVPDTECATISPEVSSPVPTRPEYPDSGLTEFDPDREIYFSCENIYTDIYLRSGGPLAVPFYILSKQPVDVETIGISADTQSEIMVMATDCGDLRGTEQMISCGMPYYLYQCYRGVDFQALYDLHKESAEEYQVAADSILGDFKSLKPEDIPLFYAYQVHLYFMPAEDAAGEEILTSLDITVNGTVYHQEIGQLRLIYDKYERSDAQELSVSSDLMMFNQLRWNEGLGQAYLYNFAVTEDMTLMGLSCLSDEFDILEILVTEKRNDGMSLSYVWDGETPVDLYAGQEICIDVVFENRWTAELSWVANLYTVLDYEKDGQAYYQLHMCQLVSATKVDCHEIYAMVFDGLNLQSYYQDFYYPTFEPWREEYRNQEGA